MKGIIHARPFSSSVQIIQSQLSHSCKMLQQIYQQQKIHYFLFFADFTTSTYFRNFTSENASVPLFLSEDTFHKYPYFYLLHVQNLNIFDTSDKSD